MIDDCTWRHAPFPFELPIGEIHVWRASLNQSVSAITQLSHILADDELARAERFVFEKDCRAFIVARGVLRLILGQYLNWAPGRLRFSYTEYGKPQLIMPSVQEPVYFNVSHSAELALYAVARGRQVGIDIERVRPIAEAENLVMHFFTARETRIFQCLPTHVRDEAFFTGWTRKEAYIKARGKGLSLPLDQFDVTLIPGEPAMLLNSRDETPDARAWSLRELSPGDGYVATLAVEGHDRELRCWEWDGCMLADQFAPGRAPGNEDYLLRNLEPQ